MSDGPYINQNQLPMHNETNMLKIIKGRDDFVVLYKPILMVGNSTEKSENVVDLTKMMHSRGKRMSENFSPSNTLILTLKGALENVWASQSEERSLVPKGQITIS